MAKGNYLVRGDKTTCGGVIVDGCEDHCLFGKEIAREADKVTCGRFPGMFNVVGGIENDSVHVAGWRGRWTATVPARVGRGLLRRWWTIRMTRHLCLPHRQL